MDSDAIDRARRRLEALRSENDGAGLAAAVERAREQLESFAAAAAQLEATLPDRVSDALHESMRAEVVPVARQLAEVRGLSAQTIRRLESLQGEVAAERRARVEDLALLVDLITSGWRSVERRLDRLESRNEATAGRLSRDGEGPRSGPVTSRNEATAGRLSRDGEGPRSGPVTSRNEATAGRLSRDGEGPRSGPVTSRNEATAGRLSRDRDGDRVPGSGPVLRLEERR